MNNKPSTNFLMNKWFWIIFTIAVFVGLYLYGLKMISDKTEIALTKKALILANGELKKCNIENTVKNSKISELQVKIKQLNSKIIQKENLISQLNDSITTLVNRPSEIEYRYNTVYKEKADSFHQFGKGNGKISLYKTCNCYNLKFWVDGEYIGKINLKYNSGIPSCGEDGTVSKIVIAGKHHIIGKDEENHSWDFYVTVIEDECLIQGVKDKD